VIFRGINNRYAVVLDATDNLRLHEMIKYNGWKVYFIFDTMRLNERNRWTTRF